MLCYSMYLQVVKVHLFNYSISQVSYVHSSRTTDESLHFRLLQKTKTLSRANADFDFQSHSRTSRTIRIFFAKICRRNFEISELKYDEIQKEHTHTHTTHTHTHTHTHLDMPMHFDFPERMCMHQSPPLSLSLSLYICENGLNPDQTRMEFRKECFVNLKICACDRK